ncbi:MAG: leucyl aminopeptidase [Allosphingosinicella sp.]|uniref:leucyl aminopeptidase n=1 Tax=Allosphingosinicella sp. TaxID=2823234 RepID=UPI003963589E
MKVTFADQRPGGAYALAIPVRGDDMLTDRLAGFDDAARRLAARAAEAQRFERELGAIAETFVDEGEAARRLLLVGLGGKRDDEALYERVGGALTARLLTSGETRLVVDLSGLELEEEAGARIAFGAAARAWRHDLYRTKLPRKQKPTLEEVVIVGGGAGAEGHWARREALLGGIAFTRELVTEPANIVYPESFVERCRAQLEPLGVEIEVLDEKAMGELGMGALLGVSLGSEKPPRLLAMRWNGAGDDRKPVVFIGKGVTFDTGGISIKPAQGMEAMKWDMGGAGAVAGAMKAIAGRKAKANVVGICGLVENMPDGKAQRPGDVVTSMSGQTIEVINTDAEGRLVLCDCMTWAQRQYKPEVMVDLATLTGAMIISLGYEYAGLFANDDGLASRLTAAGQATGDRLWRLPMGEAYDKMMDSPIADMKNSGAREAGSITAACFLGRFVEEGVKWAHLDIAGMVWANKAGHLCDKGATGYGVALLDRYVADHHEG